MMCKEKTQGLHSNLPDMQQLLADLRKSSSKERGNELLVESQFTSRLLEMMRGDVPPIPWRAVISTRR